MAEKVGDDVPWMPMLCGEDKRLQPCKVYNILGNQRADGRQMTCWKCMQHFCYRCGQRLNPVQPYTHFSQPGLGCYNQLFDNVDVGEEDWEPVEW